MEPAYLLLPVSGFIAGIVNTIAGGGSFLTLPCLMLLGLDAQLANGTNRVAVLMQSLQSVRAYNRERPIQWRDVPTLLGPSLPGLALGAYLASVVSPELFRQSMGVLFLAFAALFVAQPKRLLDDKRKALVRSRWAHAAAFFAIGLYAGFLQAGVGVLLLLALGLLGGKSLVDANGLKLAVVAVWIVPTVIFFALREQVHWGFGLLLGAGNFVGAQLGAKLATRKGNRLIFWMVLAVMLATGLSMILR